MMKLHNTETYFPNVYRYLQNKVNDSRNIPLNKFIKLYSLDGLKIMNPKTTKEVTIMGNDLDSSDYPAISAIKQYNARLHLIDGNEDVIIVIPKDAKLSEVMLDSSYYDKLKEFVNFHYSIPKNLVGYVNTDKLLSDDIQRGNVQVLVMQDKKDLVYDIYSVHTGFYETLPKLVSLKLAFLNKDNSVIHKLSGNKLIKFRNHIQHDVRLFKKRITPIMPLLMFNNLPYYRKMVQYGRMLSVINNDIR